MAGTSRALVGLFLCTIVCTPSAAGAQAVAPQPTRTFEVASIRPSPRAEPNRFGFPVMSTYRIERGGRITASQITLRELIWRAYDVQPFQVAGGPDWIGDDRFDIVAKADDGAAVSIEGIGTMLRSLLADRFKLAVRRESREQPIYAMVPSKRDGQLGAQLRPSTVDCAAVRARRTPGSESPRDGSEPDCETVMSLRAPIMTVRFVGETMDGIARLLTGPETRLVVINKTGLAGTYDGVLSFTPSPLPGLPPLPGSDTGTSMFTALQEQFGLKLQPERGLVDIITIDGAEKPAND